ncbi:PAS domain-containing protein [Candidatus Saccharibacteria bacterium]|nr:PAS domain-containing protein [Candidatus Saccharibacteria bacterium]
MQFVNDKWYTLYHRLATGVALLVALATGVALFVPGMQDIGRQWGLTYVTLILAFFQLVYAFFYKSQIAKQGVWTTTLGTSLLQATTLVTLIHGSGKLDSWYFVYWMIVVLLSGVFGTYAVAGVFFMITIYYVSVVTDQITQSMPVNVRSGVIVLGGTLLAAIISHFIWRNQYKKQESQKLAQLSGMLANKDQQAEILIESIADGIVLINTEGKISLMNTTAALMSEWPVDEALGIDVQLVMKMKTEDGQDITPAEHPFAKALINKEKMEQTLKLIGRNGKERVVSLVVSPVVVPSKKDSVGVVAVVRDISVSRAEEGRRADFVSTASHEMRTPVAAIEGYLQLALNEKVAQVDFKARNYLEKALDSTHHLGQLFQDLLTSAKAEDGRLVSHPTVVEMGAYMEEISDSLKFSADKKGLFMDYTVGVSQDGSNSAVGGGKVIKPLYYVHVDPDRLREVVTNLSDNAVKYTDAGKISIALTGNNDVVQLYIKDTGPGIPANDVPHLFQKFYRVDSSATRTIGGTGLGLFICQKIIELYNGRIWVESAVGQGSTFYINLPRLSSQKAAELQAQEAANPLG